MSFLDLFLVPKSDPTSSEYQLGAAAQDPGDDESPSNPSSRVASSGNAAEVDWRLSLLLVVAGLALTAALPVIADAAQPYCERIGSSREVHFERGWLGTYSSQSDLGN